MALTDLAPGDRVADDYVIEAVVGHGAMGAVYRALDADHDRLVALKIASPALAGLAAFHERLAREARAAAQLDHPGIASIYRVGEVDGRPFVALQWVDGSDLRTRLATGPLPTEEILSIVEQLAAALDAAHAAGCIHGDVKPANVLVRDTPSGPRAYLTDFAVAKALQEVSGAATLTTIADVPGGPSYLAPELARGADADARSDVYGLACAAFEMLSGTPPFSGPTPAAMLVAHAVRPRPLLSQRRGGLPAPVDGVLALSMAIDPAQRPASGAAFARALHAALDGRDAGLDTVAPPPPSADATIAAAPGARPVAAVAPARKRRTVALAGTAALLALAGAAAGVVALSADDAAAPATTGGVSVRPRDDTSAASGPAARAAVIDLFGAYAAANRDRSATALGELGPLASLEYPGAGERCGAVSPVREIDGKQPVSAQILDFHRQQWASGGAPIALPGLSAEQLRFPSRTVAVWKGRYDTQRRGSGTFVIAATRPNDGDAWRLFSIDFCPGKKASR